MKEYSTARGHEHADCRLGVLLKSLAFKAKMKAFSDLRSVPTEWNKKLMKFRKLVRYVVNQKFRAYFYKWKNCSE